MFNIICVSVVIFLISLCPNSNGELAPEEYAHAMKFLKKYGYMHAASNGDADSVKEAVGAMQKFAGIEETGEINAKTMEKMRSKRCSLPDMDASSGKAKRFAVVRKWNHVNDLNFIVQNHPSIASDCLTPDKIQADISDNFQIWSTAILGLKVVPASKGSKPDFNMSFGEYEHDDKYGFDGKGKTLAHGFYPQSGKVHFDDSEPWSCFGDKVNGKEGTYFKEVCLHELGHALGLGHSEDDSAVMAPYYSGTKKDLTLQADDKAGMESLYT